MAVTLITHAIAGGIPHCVTPAKDTTGADFIFLIAQTYNGGAFGEVDPPTIIDSKSNTWTALDFRVNGGVYAIGYYCANPTVGAGHTFSVIGTSVLQSALNMMAFSGVDTVFPFEQNVGRQLNASSNLTPFSDGSLIIPCYVNWNPVDGHASVSAGFTLVDSNDALGLSMATAYQVQGSAMTIAPFWAPLSSGGFSLNMVFAFRAATAQRPSILPVAFTSAGLGSGAGPVTTNPLDTTGATLLVAGTACNTVGGPGTTIAVTDSKGNVWISLPLASDINAQYSQIFYCLDPIVGTGHTFTCDAPTSNTICVGAFSGVTLFGNSVDAAIRTNVSPTITPPDTNALVISTFTWSGSFGDSIQGVGPPFGLLTSEQDVFFYRSQMCALAYCIVPVPTPTFAAYSPVTGALVLAVAEIVTFLPPPPPPVIPSLSCTVSNTGTIGVPFLGMIGVFGGTPPYHFELL